MKAHPNVYVIAGPNGSGKTTFAERFLPFYAHCRTFVNADMIARGLAAFSPDAAALKAGRLLLEQIEAYAEKRLDFAFETTLSGTAYFARLKDLKKKGYQIHLFFLWIPDVRLSLARVANRVKMGGHDIAEKVVRRRFYKGLQNFFKVYRPILDTWMLFDNSGHAPYPVAKEEQRELQIVDRALYDKILKAGGR